MDSTLGTGPETPPGGKRDRKLVVAGTHLWSGGLVTAGVAPALKVVTPPQVRVEQRPSLGTGHSAMDLALGEGQPPPPCIQVCSADQRS